MTNYLKEQTIGNMSVGWRRALAWGLKAGTGSNGRELFAELNPHLIDNIKARAHYEVSRKAGVLLLIIDRPSGPYLVYTVRTDDMPSHAGQISFPGGGKKEEDATLIDTALREAEEEIGLDTGKIDVQGVMNTHFGAQGFAVTPVVAIGPADITITANPREVAEIFEVPLEFIMQPCNHLVETRADKGMQYNMYALPFKEYHIWGLTAGITRSFYEMLA